VNSVVGVGAGVSVTGIGVCVAESVAVGESKIAGVGVAMAGWQPMRKIRHPIRIFFIALIKT